EYHRPPAEAHGRVAATMNRALTAALFLGVAATPALAQPPALRAASAPAIVVGAELVDTTLQQSIANNTLDKNTLDKKMAETVREVGSCASASCTGPNRSRARCCTTS
ncbi:MAG: hypothetical protein ABL982_24850, partial [Vicinamibacterales bacterium]